MTSAGFSMATKAPGCHQKHLPAILSPCRGMRFPFIGTLFHLKVKAGSAQVGSAAENLRILFSFLCRTQGPGNWEGFPLSLVRNQGPRHVNPAGQCGKASVRFHSLYLDHALNRLG